MELATWSVGKLLDYTVNPIGRQVGYLIFYRSNVKALKEQLEALEAKRIAVQHSITEATTNEEKIEVQVQNWMRKVEGITGQAQQFYEEESQAKSGCTRTSCPNLFSRHQLGRRAKKMALQVAEICGNGNFDRISYCDSPEWIQASITGETNEGFESRMSVITQIMEALGDPNVTMIGLSGLGGVGKTTIVKEVAKRVKEEKMFKKVIMAKVSDDPNLEKIQGQIAEMMGMKLDERNESIRAFRLHERLKEEKNMLLILDDLWKKLELDQVGIPFDDDDNKNKEQSKILLTSRNEKLLSDQMKCKRNIKVDVLSETEAWELFRGIAELPDDSNLHFVANKIVQRCGGLPVSIVAAAGALRKKDPTQWKDALQRLGNPLQRNITGIKEADSILRLSYDHLSQELQPIFLLSAMLSHNPLNLDLLMYSLGLGLLQGIDTMEKARDGIEALVSKLKASNLLLDSFSSDCFTMHDVVRDVTLSIASNEQHTLVVRHRRLYEWPDKNLLEGYTRILLDKSDINDLPQELYCPRLELFLLNSMDSNLRVPSTFFKSMNELKAIGFTDTHFPSLPSSLGLLEKLRTLCLHSCVLEDIAEIGNLKYLKVLSLAHSNIKQLPCELAQLTCLQMLNLAHCSKLEVIPPKLLSILKRLEVLYMENSFKHWEAEGSSKGNENASLAELKHLTNLSSLNIHIPYASVLPKDLFLGNSLERYKILIGEDWEWLGKYESSKTLKLKLKSSIHLEHGIQKLLESVEDLHLDELNGITNVLYDLDWRGFPQLKHLWVQNNDQIEYIVNNSTRLVGAFPYVETLNLYHLKGLKKLCQGRIMAASFQNLRVIKVKNCNELKSIFSILTVGLFCQLVEIKIAGCNSMKGIVVSTNEDSLDQQKLAFHVIFHQLRYLKMKDLPTLVAFYFEENAIHDKSNKVSNSLFSNKVSFPNLETLKLFSINNLIPSIWDDRLPQNSFGNLKTLLVRKCGFLVKLVPLHVLNCLRNLEELKVLDCELLEMVFDFEELSGYKETQLSWVVPLK